MVVPSGSVQLGFSDSDINDLLRRPLERPGESGAPTRHFSQNEEFFVRLPKPVRVASFPVHHDLGQKRPDKRLIQAVRDLVRQVCEAAPELLVGLTHVFDPSSNHRPAFFRIYQIQDTRFLYVLRIDLTFRPMRGERISRVTNRDTAEYETSDLFLESDLYPVADIQTRGNRITDMHVEQVIRDTWIGETGRGYMRAGMWLDRDLTKFFSRLFTPSSLQTYPYYPFTCKYRTIAHATVATNESERTRAVQIAKRGRDFLMPHVRAIEEALRSVPQNEFREDLPAFRELKKEASGVLDAMWSDFSIRSYLNESDEREFEVVRGLR